jgi:hypothetical protein
MLSWAPGRRDTDGVWAKHWYAAVERSTGFEPYRARPARVPESHAGVLVACATYYQKLYEHRLRASE